MTTTQVSNAASDTVDASCRLTIGVWGDSSCALLKAHVHCRNCPIYARGSRILLTRANIASSAASAADDRTPPVTGTLQALMVFRVRGERVAIRAGSAREVVEPTALHRVPHRGDRRFLGLANIRGEILPVADLAELLEMPPAQLTGRHQRAVARLLVIERGSEAWVLPVTEVEGIHRADLSTVHAPPVTIELGRAAFTSGVLDTPHGPVAILDEDTLWYALQRVCR
ncbi:MAG: chemotaxis protein CheW [Pseudomonadales bacterium]